MSRIILKKTISPKCHAILYRSHRSIIIMQKIWQRLKVKLKYNYLVRLIIKETKLFYFLYRERHFWFIEYIHIHILLLRKVDLKAVERNVIVRLVCEKKSLTTAAPTKIRFAGWSSVAMGGHNRGDWESGENWRRGGRKRKPRILTPQSFYLSLSRCSLTSRGNEVENRILRGSTHLFFTFHEDTNVGFRAPLRFPDISNVSESRSGFPRQPSARKLRRIKKKGKKTVSAPFITLSKSREPRKHKYNWEKWE